MFFEEYGNKKNPTLLFLHGAMAFHSFARQQELADKFHLIFYTLPGHGLDYSRHFERETAIKEAVKIAQSVKKDSVNIIGFSLGAQLTLKLLNDYGNLFNKAVIVSPLVDATDLNLKVLSLTTRLIGYTTKLTALAKLVSMYIGIDGKKYQQFKREQKSQRVNSLSTDILKDMLKSSDIGNISNIDNRVLILAGEYEPFSFKRSAFWLKDNIKNSELEIFGTAGHNIPYAFYKRFNLKMKEFFGNDFSDKGQ